MALTDTKVKNAKAGHKTTRLYDEKGLYLEVSSKGGKWWRFKYLRVANCYFSCKKRTIDRSCAR